MLIKPIANAAAFVIIIIGCFVWLRADTWIVDTEQNGGYTLELVALTEPEWPFGPQNGRIMLTNNGSVLCEQDFRLYNDGKNMDESNWSVAWDDEKAAVTITGEEQPYEVYYLYYTGFAERREIS